MPTANINWNGQTYRINFDRKLTDNEVYNYMQQNYPKQETIEAEEKIKMPNEKKDLKTFVSEDLQPSASKAYNFLRSIGQGATFGQGSHLAGTGQAYGGALYDILHGKKPKFADIAKDYTEGREQFKKEYKDFSDKNKALAFGGELLGGVGTGIGSGVLKGISLAKKPILNAIASGTGIGGLYGASNTEGKGIDLKNAGIGAGLGAILSVAGLGGAKLGQKAIGQFGTLGRLYGKGVDKIAKAIKPVNELVDEEGKVLQGTVSSYVRPAGTQNRTARLFAENPHIQKEALNGDVGLRFEEYGNKAVNGLSKIKEVVKQAENNAYKEAGITDNYVIDLSKSNVLDDLINAQRNYNDEIALFANSTKANTNLGNDLLNDLQIATVANGNRISFGNLKRITNKLYNDKQKAYKDFGGGSAEYKLLRDFYDIMSNLKYQDANLSKATAKFAELSKAIENLENATGINLEKTKGFASKIFSGARDRADGGVQEKALEDFTRIMDKYADTKALKSISDDIKMAQFAYDIRPTNIDSKFARDVAQGVTKGNTILGLGTTVLKKLAIGKDLNPQEFYQILARRIKEGKVKPNILNSKFNRISVKGLDDITANRLYWQNQLLGNRAGILGKIIKEFK